MKNKKWGTTSYTDEQIHVVLFVSRQKDNKTLADFTERRVSFITTYKIDDPELVRKFKDFVRAGQTGELCRMYYSVNARDPKTLHKKLLMFLIDEPDFNLCSLQSKIAGLAAQADCAFEKRWMFDFDIDDQAAADEFCADIMKCSTEENPIMVECHKTPHGYAIISSRGFDNRELLKKWTDVTIKKDDLLCVYWEIAE